MYLYCWTEFCAGVLVHSHPFTTSAESHSTSLDSGLPVCCRPSYPALSTLCATRHRHRDCAWCCDVHCWMAQFSHPLTSAVTAAEVMSTSFPQSNGLVAVNLSQAQYTQVRKPSHLEIKLQSGMCLFAWKKSSVWSSSADPHLLPEAGQVIYKVAMTKPDNLSHLS